MSRERRTEELAERLQDLDAVTPLTIAIIAFAMAFSLLPLWMAIIPLMAGAGLAAFALRNWQLKRRIENEWRQLTGEHRKTSTASYLQRPLSIVAAIVAALAIVVPLYQRSLGKVYLESLNYVDGTTIAMVGILLLRGILSRRADTDLQAVSIALVGALSFVFCYEAIYKLSFYTFPWRMPPPEIREFVIQVGIALTALVGFAFDKFVLSRPSQILLVVFALSWVFWLLLGFPQLESGRPFYPALISIPLTRDGIYVVGRATKVALFLAYFSLYSYRGTRRSTS